MSTCSSLKGPSWPARSATVRATRRARSRPRADKRPSRSLRSRRRLAPALRGATVSSCHGGTSALQRTPRPSWASRRAASTRAATTDEGSSSGPTVPPVDDDPVRPPLVPKRASTSGRRTRMRRSKRSRSGPEMRAAYRARALSVQRHEPGAPSAPQRQAFMAPTSMKRAGKETAALARQTTTRPSSKGWRKLSSTEPGNSANSSRNRTPTVGAADLARPEPGPTPANQRHGGGAVMGRPERRPHRQSAPH